MANETAKITIGDIDLLEGTKYEVTTFGDWARGRGRSYEYDSREVNARWTIKRGDAATFGTVHLTVDAHSELKVHVDAIVQYIKEHIG